MTMPIWNGVRRRLPHPVLTFGIVAGLAVDSYYYFLHYPSDSNQAVLAFAVYIALCMAVPWFPRAASIAVIVWYLCCAVLPATNAGAMLTGTCVAIAAVFAFMNTAICLALISSCALVLYLTTDTDTMIAIMIFQTFAALTGYTCKRHADSIRQREQLAEAQRTVAALSRDMALAAQLHDTVTNDLSYIITVASTERLDAKSAVHKAILDSVINRSQDAFAKTHEVIDVLSGSKHRDVSAATECRLKAELESIMDAGQRRLRRLGFTGSCIVRGSDGSMHVLPDVHTEIRGLLLEIFANLRRHCNPPTDYTVAVDIQHEVCTFTTMNTVNRTRLPKAQSSGRGLHLHQTIIESIGGKLDFAVDGDIWTLHAVIPLMGNDRH